MFWISLFTIYENCVLIDHTKSFDTSQRYFQNNVYQIKRMIYVIRSILIN